VAASRTRKPGRNRPAAPLTSLTRRLACQYPADGIQSEEVAGVPRTHGLVPRNHHG